MEFMESYFSSAIYWNPNSRQKMKAYFPIDHERQLFQLGPIVFYYMRSVQSIFVDIYGTFSNKNSYFPPFVIFIS